MNRKALRRLANALEQECMRDPNDKPIAFAMNHWISENNSVLETKYGTQCGTIACIGGHAEMLFEHGYLELELCDNVREALFYPIHYYHDITREHAILQIRRLIMGSRVNWAQTIEDYDNGDRLTDDDIKEFCRDE